MRFIRSTKCPLRYRVQWDKRDGKWQLFVKVTRWWHNHTVTSNAYETLPVARGIKDPEAAQRADEMVSDGVRRAAVYDMLLSKGENVFKVDVDNFVNTRHHRVGLVDDNEATANVIAKFSAENDGSVVTVDETDRGETGVISLTTRHMRGTFSRFGELLLVDCTHKTNRYNYQLCTFMVMDEFGKGQCIQQSLFETNGDWHMHRAIDHLKRANAESWKLVRVIVVDKDLNEIRVLQTEFPEARVLICHFHVLKYLTLMAHKPQYGKISSDDHKVLEHVIHRMVYAETSKAFDNARVSFLRFCDTLKFGAFAEYMDKNWFSCTEMWALFQRAKPPHFRNHTNNRLESWFGCFKEGVNENSSMSQCVQALVLEARRCKNEYDKLTHQNGSWRNQTYDEEMGNVLLTSNPFVATAILPEYKCAFDKFGTYEYEEAENDHYAIVKGTRTDHVIDLLDWSCDCPFSKTMRLPCRHVMAYRKNKGGSSVIPLLSIDMRWKRETRPLQPVPRFKLNPPTKERPNVPETVPSSAASRNRYNEALRALQPIASELAEIEDPIDFHKYLEFLSVQWRNIRQRKRTGESVPPVDASDAGVAASVQNDNDEGQKAQNEEQKEDEGHDEEYTERDEDHDVEDTERDNPPSSPAAQVDLSQTNSLYSEELGGSRAASSYSNPLRVAIPRPVSIDEYTSGPIHARDAEISGRDVDKVGVTSAASGDASVPIHGRDVEISGRDMDKVGADRPTGHDVDTSGHSKDDGYVEDGASEGVEPAASVQSGERTGIVINLNPKAAKSGRPRTDRQAAVAEQRMSRARFNASESVRSSTGELTLIDVLRGLNSEQPSLEETRRRLSGVFTKFVRTDAKKPRPTYKQIHSPTLNQEWYYLLPPKMLAACMAALPLATGDRGSIGVDTPPATRSRRNSPASISVPPDGLVEVVAIANLGLFSREQIQTMRQVEVLKTKCDTGDQFCKWLRQQVASAVPAAVQDHARKIADDVAAMYPSAPVKGLSRMSEYDVAMLYRVQPPAWLSDATIRAFCERLEQSHSFVRVAGAQTAKKGAGRAAKGQRVGADQATRMASLAAEDGVTTVILPINFGNYHWTGMYVHTPTKTITYYDSMNISGCMKPLDDLARNLCEGEQPAFPDFTVVSLNSPVQQDGFSCGLFVCFRFWRLVDPTVSADMSDYGLTKRRLEFLHFVLYGSKM